MNESVVLPAREAIHSYVAHVRLHLSDLPAEELDELVGGLEADLAERAAELPAGSDLTSSFGAPEVYAAELRSAAGLPPRVTGAPIAPRRNGLREVEASVRADRDRWLVRWPWLKDLRPAWWLARGAMAGLFPIWWVGVGLRNPVAWLFVLGGAAVSFAWSRRDPAPSSWSNRLLVLGNVAAVLLVLPFLALLPARVSQGPEVIYESSPGPVSGDSGVWVNGEAALNLYAYDAEGNRIDNVRLFNQYGQAVSVPSEAWFNLPPDQQPPMTQNGTFEVNGAVFPVRWGSRTGWEASAGGQWEPPVKISTLPPTAGPATSGASTPGASTSGAPPMPDAQASSGPSPLPGSADPAQASPSPSATP
jgi:hypothetical protein